MSGMALVCYRMPGAVDVFDELVVKYAGSVGKLPIASIFRQLLV